MPVLTVSADPGQLLQDEGEEGPVQGVWGSHWQSQGRGRKEDNKLYFLNLENCKMISQGMFNRLLDAPASLKPVVSLIKQTQIAEITTELVSKIEITSKSPTFVNSASMVCHNLLTQAYQRRATGILKKDLTGTCLPRLWWTTLYQVCPFSLQGAHILRSTPTSWLFISSNSFCIQLKALGSSG